MAAVDDRTQHWLDGLQDGQRSHAMRVLSMPGGSMAVAYVAVELHRMEHELPSMITDAVREAMPTPFKGDVLSVTFSALFSALMVTFGTPWGHK